ncbi:zinc finger protein 431-like isoform X2 [Hetaerina americana]|uniref:zinc finger protein 431-like isoform X2 n=1 Tax=Hetaerina americana TaxID=62018 RepID=UPI003A7F26E7
MCDQMDILVCRLCLNSGGQLVNIFDENTRSEFMLEKTIEDLINVVEDARYPWLVCCNCMEKLTEFRLFKHRCAECLFVFYNRIQKECNPATKVWITNGQELPGGIKKECCDETIVSDAVDRTAVDVRDDMIVVKEEVDTASECSESLGRDIDSLMVASMQEGCSHWSDSEEVGNMDYAQDGPLSFNKEVDIKEECGDEIPEEEGCLGGEVLQGQDCGKGRDGVMTILHMCQYCNDGFAQKEDLEAHVIRRHSLKARDIRRGIDSEGYDCTSDIVPESKTYKCAICLRSFPLKNKLKRHLLIHTGERPHKCPVCPKAFTLKQYLQKHVLVHSEDRCHKCEMCPKTFKLKKQLKEHSLTHKGEKLHKCEVCSRAFTQKANLRRHVLIHTGERPHKCEICSKGFHHKQHLEGHMLTHTGERPHKCPVCPKAFTLKQHLRKHVLLHNEDGCHKCEMCLKTFELKQQLKEHRLMHKGEKRYKCEVCSRAFTQKANLKRHVLIHTGE